MNIDAEHVTLYSAVAKRWRHWHANSRKKEEKDELINKYTCMKGFEVPALNPKLSLKLHESTLKRDEHFRP